MERIERIRARLKREEYNNKYPRFIQENTDTFVKRLMDGKLAEQRVKAILESLGAKVEDISYEECDNHYSPFDLRATTPRGIFVIDVKNQIPSKKVFRIFKHQYPRWKAYETKATKLIAFFNDRPRAQEYTKHLAYVLRCIRVDDIGDRRAIPFEETKEINEIGII